MKWDGRLACCDYPVLRTRVRALVVRTPTQLVRVGAVRMRVSKARGVLMMRIAIVRMAERRLNECPEQARNGPDVKQFPQPYFHSNRPTGLARPDALHSVLPMQHLHCGSTAGGRPRTDASSTVAFVSISDAKLSVPQ